MFFSQQVSKADRKFRPKRKTLKMFTKAVVICLLCCSFAECKFFYIFRYWIAYYQSFDVNDMIRQYLRSFSFFSIHLSVRWFVCRSVCLYHAWWSHTLAIFYLGLFLLCLARWLNNYFR